MIGKTISQYKIFEKPGESGMGVVCPAGDNKVKMKLFFILLNQFLLIFFLNQPIYAQNNKISFDVGDSSFHNIKGTWTISNYIEFYDSEDIVTPIAIYQFNSETAYYLTNGFSIVGNMYLMYPHGFRFNDSDEFEVRETFGMGVSGFLRLEFIKLFGHNFFAETGFGFLGTTRNFPPMGTSLNFTQRYGFGTNIPLNKNLVLVFAVRHMHISNGKGFVRENPQYNGNGLYMGVKFEL